jgi:hypothetical protein
MVRGNCLQRMQLLKDPHRGLRTQNKQAMTALSTPAQSLQLAESYDHNTPELGSSIQVLSVHLRPFKSAFT